MMVVRSRAPREVLNEIRFRRRASGGNPGLDGAEVTILHRTGPANLPSSRTISGRDILRLERGFLYVSGRRGETAIPYHRVLSISWRGGEVWKRP